MSSLYFACHKLTQNSQFVHFAMNANGLKFTERSKIQLKYRNRNYSTLFFLTRVHQLNMEGIIVLKKKIKGMNIFIQKVSQTKQMNLIMP